MAGTDPRIISDEVYYSRFENNTDVLDILNIAEGDRTAEQQSIVNQLNTLDESGGLGYGQFTPFVDMVNNFMANYVGEDSLVQNVKRRNVEFFMQRGIQELNYDVFKSTGILEYQLQGSLSIPLPQSAVSVTKVSWIDDQGNFHPVRENRHAGSPTAFEQDGDGEYVYDENGARIPSSSETIDRLETNDISAANRAFQNYYANSSANFELIGSYNSYDGRRYGLEPELTNINGVYIYNDEEGIIYVDSGLSDRYMIIEYVSDGLGSDLSKIRVHKQGEEAIYDYVIWQLLKTKGKIPLYDKQFAKKNFYNSKRRTKHRLSKTSPIDMFAVLKQKAKWIQH